MTTRIVTDSNGRKHITNEPMLHKPCRQWVGLTDEEIQTIWRHSEHMDVNEVCQAIESKLKEKNT
jgi:hypothetical protein